LACAAGLLLSGGLTGQAAALELQMYYPIAVGGPLTKIIDGMVADFQKENAGIAVKAVYAGNYTDTMTKAMTALRGGEPPQLSVILSTEIFTLIDEDAVVPFDDLVTNAEDKAWLNSFYPGFLANSRTGGKTWSIPFQRSTIVMYYNRDAFRAAGLNPDQPPATWKEMVAAGKKLTKKDASGNVTQWGLEIPSTGYPYWMFGALCMQNGQVLMNEAGTQTYFDAPATIQALEFWKSLSYTEGVMPKGAIEWGTLRTDFVQGKTAMMWHTTGNLTAVKEEAKFDFGVAMLPAEKRRGTPTGGGNFVIFKKTNAEQRAASLRFIKWMTQPVRAAEWSIKTGYVATRSDAYETPVMKEYAKGFPPAVVARDQLQYATAELSTHENGRIYKILNDALQAALATDKSPAAELKQAQAQAERVLRQFR
jgi:sn-glycerol 3-phosphate transport system substrate-binding protein